MDAFSLIKLITPECLRRGIADRLRGYIREEVGEIARQEAKEVVQEAKKVAIERIERIEYARQLNSMIVREPWTIDTIEFSEDHIEIHGWALPPDGDPGLATFTVNGKIFEEVHYPLIRPDIGEMLWYRYRAAESGFICRKHLPKDAVESDQYVLSFLRKDTMEPVREDHNYHCLDHRTDTLPIPEPDRRRRVHGNDSENSFRTEGHSAFAKLELTLMRFFGRKFSDFSHILDWGCGCGRVTRYFADVEGSSVTGLDIDNDNVMWCQSNLPFGEFRTIPLHPPTGLKDSSFDLLIGISVFTHLREKEQFEWLDELRRIAKPGAILLMTILGDHGVCRGGLEPSQFDEWNRKGISAVKSNPDLDGSISDTEYYRNTFHTYKYIKEKWAQYFSIVDIIQSYVGNQQDLVIMRTPS